MSLDCNTALGQVYIKHQIDCINKLEIAWDCMALPTKPDAAADIDVIFVKNGYIGLVGEIKSREMSLKELQKFGSYLITQEKLIKLRNVAIALCVPSVVVVSLLKDDVVVYWKLTDSKGEFKVAFKEKVTETKRTCNGGKVYRNNAYISLDEMQILN